jgi:hypothetical protein
MYGNYGSNSNNMNNNQYDYNNNYDEQRNNLYTPGTPGVPNNMMMGSGYNPMGGNMYGQDNQMGNNMGGQVGGTHYGGNSGWGNSQFREGDYGGTNLGPSATNLSEAPDNVNNKSRYLKRLKKGNKPDINVPENEKPENNETLTEKYIKNSMLLGKHELYNPLNPDPMKSLFFRLHVTGVIESASVRQFV